MSTRPSFQFYPGDWQSNSNLRRCTHAEKGVWLDVMCLMHDQPEYGILRWTLKEIAQAIGSTVANLKALQAKGVLKGDDKQLSEPFVYIPRSGRKDGEPVTLVGTQDGPIWYSSRMVKDEYVRTIRADSSGNSATPKGTPKDAPKPPFGEGFGGGFGPCDAGTRAAPSSSSSSPSSNTPLSTQSTSTSVAPDPSPGARVCLALKPLGIRGNPSHPMLQALVDAGATPQEFVDAAPAAHGKADPFAYLLGVVQGRRRDAADVAKGLHKGPIPPTQSKPPTAAEMRVFQSSPQLMDPAVRARCEAFANAGKVAPEAINFIDMETHNGLAIGMD